MKVELKSEEKELKKAIKSARLNKKTKLDKIK